MMKAIVYSTPSCRPCQTLENYLNKKNINYIKHDISKNQEKAQEMVNKSGVMVVPVIDLDGEIITGFDKEKLDRKFDA